jgi:uncharacterized protein YdiU (UPF0061 family)
VNAQRRHPDAALAEPPQPATGRSSAARPRFARLGAPYVQAVPPTPLPAPQRLWSQDTLAADMGLPAAWWRSDQATAVLAGNAPWPGCVAQASIYAGHQFGRFSPALGDGRALLVAELDTPQGPCEVQLKGAGPTPHSRGLDGRAVLRSSVREALASEALHALGVPTTRALALVGAPLRVQRGERSETAAVLCRVAPSFVRFGHFEYFQRSGQAARLQPLADWVIAEHFPHLRGARRAHALWLAEVVSRTAALMAAWQTLGFCHGVMNTDNVSILGLTLDYGPFGFMERFRMHHVCNLSDHEGRYAYSAQPAVGRWNCERLLEATRPLLDGDEGAAREHARDLLTAYDAAYGFEVMRRWRAKLGLAEARAGDADLVRRFLGLLQAGRLDFTLAFRELGELPAAEYRQRFAEAAAFDAWHADWRARLAAEGTDAVAAAARMRGANPLYVLRNHLAQEATDAAQRGDLRPLRRLMHVLSRPFEAQPGCEHEAAPAPAGSAAVEVDCSS